MHIWVDADACPAVIKDILYRAAERTKTGMTLVANTLLKTPPSEFVRAIQVERGFDVADDENREAPRARGPGVTADIPLAAQVIERGGHALKPARGVLHPDNIRERLAQRDFLEALRAGGERRAARRPSTRRTRSASPTSSTAFSARQARA